MGSAYSLQAFSRRRFMQQGFPPIKIVRKAAILGTIRQRCNGFTGRMFTFIPFV